MRVCLLLLFVLQIAALPASFPRTGLDFDLELTLDPCAEPSMQFDGVDYFGSDLQTGIASADATACCRSCAANSLCKAWTYGSDVKKCWLKTASSAVQKANRKSGVMTPPAVSTTSAQTTAATTAKSTAAPTTATDPKVQFTAGF